VSVAGVTVRSPGLGDVSASKRFADRDMDHEGIAELQLLFDLDES